MLPDTLSIEVWAEDVRTEFNLEPRLTFERFGFERAMPSEPSLRQRSIRRSSEVRHNRLDPLSDSDRPVTSEFSSTRQLLLAALIVSCGKLQ